MLGNVEEEGTENTTWANCSLKRLKTQQGLTVQASAWGPRKSLLGDGRPPLPQEPNEHHPALLPSPLARPMFRTSARTRPPGATPWLETPGAPGGSGLREDGEQYSTTQVGRHAPWQAGVGAGTFKVSAWHTSK